MQWASFVKGLNLGTAEVLPIQGLLFDTENRLTSYLTQETFSKIFFLHFGPKTATRLPELDIPSSTGVFL